MKENNSNIQDNWISDTISKFGAYFADGSEGASFSTTADGSSSYHANYDDTGIRFATKLDYMDTNCPAGPRIYFGSTMKGIYHHNAVPNNESYRATLISDTEYQRFFTISESRMGTKRVKGSFLSDITSNAHSGHFLNDVFGLADCKIGDESGEYVNPPSAGKLIDGVKFEYSVDDSASGMGKYQQYAFIPLNMATGAPGELGQPNLDLKGKTSDWNNIGYYASKYTSESGYNRSMHIDGLSFIDYANMNLTNSWNPFTDNYDWPWSDTKNVSLRKILDDYKNSSGQKLYKNVDIYKDKKDIVNTSKIYTHHADDPRSYLDLKNGSKNWLDDHYVNFQSPGAQGYLGKDVEYFPSELYPINLLRSAAAWDILYGKNGARKDDEPVFGTFASGQNYNGFRPGTTEGTSSLKLEYVFCEAMQEQTSPNGRFGGLAAVYEDCPIVERDGGFYIQTKNVLWWKHLFPWYYVTGTIPGDVFPGMSNLPEDHNFYSWVNIYGDADWTTCASCKAEHNSLSNSVNNNIGSHSGPSSYVNSRKFRENFSNIFDNKNNSTTNVSEKIIQSTSDVSEFALEGLKNEAFEKFTSTFVTEKDNDKFKYSFKTLDPEIFLDGKKLSVGYYWLKESDRDLHAYKELEIKSDTKYLDGSLLTEEKLEKILLTKKPRLETIQSNKYSNFENFSLGWTYFNFKNTSATNLYKNVLVELEFDEDVTFEYEIYIDGKYKLDAGNFSGKLLRESINVSEFLSFKRLSLRVYNKTFKRFKYTVMFRPSGDNICVIDRSKTCIESLDDKVKVNLHFEYNLNQKKDIIYEIFTENKSVVDRIVNKKNYNTISISKTIENSTAIKNIKVYIANRNDELENQLPVDILSDFNECKSSELVYANAKIKYNLDINSNKEHFISFNKQIHNIGSNLNLPKDNIKIKSDFNFILTLRMKIKIDEDTQSPVDVSDDFLKNITKYEGVSFSYNKKSNAIDAKFKDKRDIVIDKTLWNMPVDFSNIRYFYTVVETDKKTSTNGYITFVDSDSFKIDNWVDEYYDGDHTVHSFETDYEITPIIPAPNFKERNHTILGRTTPLHQSIYSTNNFSLVEDINQESETTIQDVNDDLEINTVVDTAEFMNEVMLSKEGQIVTQLAHQFHNLIFYQHTINEGAWLSGTDTLFYLLDTVGGFIDGKAMVLGGVAKLGAKAARVAPLMGKIGKVSSVLDDTIGMKGLSSLGKLGMHTIGHSAKQVKFMQSFAEWCIKKGITTSDSLKVRYASVDDAGNIVSNPGYVAGILDHFGLWKMPPGKSKIGITEARKTSPNEFYSRLLETTDELNTSNLSKFNENPAKFQIDDQQGRIVDDFFEELMEKMGDDILKAENGDVNAMPIGPIDQYFNGGNFWTDIVSEDTYKVWRTLEPGDVAQHKDSAGVVKKSKSLKKGIPTDSAIVTMHGDKEIFLPLEIIPEKHREVVTSWLKSNPQSITSDMQKFIDDQMPIWIFMHKLHLLDKYANLDYDSFMKILAVSDKLFGSPVYYSETGIGFLGGANRGVIENTLVRIVDKTDAAFSLGGSPFKMTKQIINQLDVGELEKILTSFAANFEKTLKLNGKNSKYLKNIDDQSEHFTKAESEIEELQSRINKIKQPANGKQFKENAKNILKKNMSGNDNALDLNHVQNYLLAYINKMIPDNATPAELLPFIKELEDTIEKSLAVAKINISNNKLKTQKIKDKIDAGGDIGIEIQTGLAKHNEDRKAFYKNDHTANLVDGTKFDRIFKIKFADELGEKSPVQKFMDAMPKLRNALKDKLPNREALAFQRFYNDQYFAIKEFGLNTAAYIEIKELLKKFIVNRDLGMGKSVAKNIKYFMHDGLTRGEIALFQNMTIEQVKLIQKVLQKVVIEPSKKVEESTLDQIFYIINNPGAVDASTEKLAREVFEQINILSCQADKNLDSLAGYGTVVKNSETEDATRRLSNEQIDKKIRDVELESAIFTPTPGESSAMEASIQSATDIANKLMDEILKKSKSGDPIISRPVESISGFVRGKDGKPIKEYRIYNTKEKKEYWVTEEIAKDWTNEAKYGNQYTLVLNKDSKPLTRFKPETYIKSDFHFSLKDILKNVTKNNVVDDYIKYAKGVMGKPDGKQFYARVGDEFEYINGVPHIKKKRNINSGEQENSIMPFDFFAQEWINEQAYQITNTIRKTVATRLKDFKKIKRAVPVELNARGTPFFPPPRKLNIDEYDFAVENISKLKRTASGRPYKTYKYYKIEYREEPLDLEKIMPLLGVKDDTKRISGKDITKGIINGYSETDSTHTTAGRMVQYVKGGLPIENILQDNIHLLLKDKLNKTTGLFTSKDGQTSQYGSLLDLRKFLQNRFPQGIGLVKITDDLINPEAEDYLKVLEALSASAKTSEQVKVQIKETVSSGANNYSIPDSLESMFARPSLYESDGIQKAGRGVFGTSNHDFSVFQGLLELEKMQNGNYASLEELAKAIHKGWKNSGISRKQTKKDLGSKLGVVEDLKTLDLQEHILALHTFLQQANGPVGYILGRGVQGKTDRVDLKAILSTFTRTTRFSPIVDIGGKKINIITEINRRSPPGGWNRKYKANQPTRYPVGHPKENQIIPQTEMEFDLVPEEGGPFKRNGEPAGPFVVGEKNTKEPDGLENYRLAVKKFFEIIEDKIKNTSGKELEEILNELPTGGTHPNVNYIKIDSDFSNPLYVPDMDFRRSEITIGGAPGTDGHVVYQSPVFKNWIKYLEKNSAVSRAEKVGAEKSFDEVIDFSEKVKDLPTAVTLLTQFPEFLRKYLAGGVSIDDIETLFHLRSKKSGDDKGYAAVNNFLGADITHATGVQLPGMSRRVIIDEGGSVLQGKGGGVDNVTPDGYDFKSSGSSSSGASATDEFLNISDDLLEQYNKMNNSTIFDFAKILGKSKFIEAIFKGIPVNKIVDSFDRNKAAGLFFTAHAGVFAKLGNTLRQAGSKGTKGAKSGTDKGGTVSGLNAQSQNWKWNTPLKAGPGIIFTPISSWAGAYSHLAQAIGNDTQNITTEDWNSTISGVVNEKGVPQDQMCAMFIWKDSASIDLGFEQFSWQLGAVGSSVGMPVQKAMQLLSGFDYANDGDETDVSDPPFKESYRDRIRYEGEKVEKFGNSGSGYGAGASVSYSISIGEMGVPLYGGIYGSPSIMNLIDNNPNPGVCWSAKEQAKRGYGYYKQETTDSGRKKFTDYSIELHSQDVCFACWNAHFPEAFCKESDEWPCSTSDGNIDLEADTLTTETANRYMGVNTDYYDMDPGSYSYNVYSWGGTSATMTRTKKGIPTPRNQGAIDPDFRPNF